MRTLFRACLALSALCGTVAATAQDIPDDQSSPIVVTGRKDTDQRIRELADTLQDARGLDQIGRFETQGICPAALGILDQQQRQVEARMRLVARTVGIPLAGAKCTPNALVVVTDDKRRFIERLEQKRPYWFVSLSLPAVRRLARSPGPAAVWHVEGTLNGDGLDLGVRDYYGASSPNQSFHAPSLITAATRPHFNAGIVVLNIQALEGLSTTQLADYAAMRIFAPTDPSKLAAPYDTTILRILDAPRGTAVPLSLTHWDVGLLKGLYSARDNLYTGAQKNEVRKQIEQELKRDGPGSNRRR
jgi:hypothetical protein